MHCSEADLGSRLCCGREGREVVREKRGRGGRVYLGLAEASAERHDEGEANLDEENDETDDETD